MRETTKHTPPPLADPPRDLGTTGAVVAAAAAAGGAWLAVPVPRVLAAALVGLGWVAGRRVVVVVGLALLASGAGAAALAGLDPVERGAFDGTVELVSDPRPAGPVGWRAEVRLPSGQRVRATAHGAPGRALSALAFGQRVAIRGRLAPFERPSAWTVSRHLVGGMAVDEVGSSSPGGLLARAAARVRDAVTAGARALPSGSRPLYLGLVVGDDRFQTPSQQAAFRVAGLSHLLAVSGQNVAFVLLVAGPFLRSFPTWPRFGLMVAVLVVFAAVTRFEPSVLRATVTAAIVGWSVVLGRPNRGLRVLALAVVVLVVLDPLLVRSVGFQLSVAASAGILVLGPPLEALLPGPRRLTQPLAVTLAAQVAVLPVLTTVFGPVSLVSVPANLAVAAAAGLVMTWGLTVGVVAGAVGGPAASVLQLPATAAVGWIDAVARFAAVSPAPRVAAGFVPLLLLAVAVAVWSPGGRRLGGAAAIALLVLPALGGRPGSGGDLTGGRWCRGARAGSAIVVIDEPARVAALIEDVVDLGFRRVDAVILRRGTGPFAAAVTELGSVVALGVVLAPAQHQVRGADAVKAPTVVPSASGEVAVEPVGRAELSVWGCGGVPPP